MKYNIRTQAQALALLTDNSTIHQFELGYYNETGLTLQKNVMVQKYHSFKKGDIYFRTRGKKVRFQIFTGERDSFFDHSYGMGSVTYGAVEVNPNDLFDFVYNKQFWILNTNLTNHLKSKGII